MNAEELLAFEADIAAEFDAGKIPHPVHLAGGNEMQLIEIFKGIASEDWVACGWRSHYHALLKGVPPDVVKSAIMAGRSINMCFRRHRIISSAIVGGICPIALGIAASLKRDRMPGTVWCFVGDMTASGGIFAECMRYAMGHDLPINFVMEDNNLSVCTPTREVWGNNPPVSKFFGYSYILSRPHVGTGKWVRF